MMQIGSLSHDPSLSAHARNTVSHYGLISITEIVMMLVKGSVCVVSSKFVLNRSSIEVKW